MKRTAVVILICSLPLGRPGRSEAAGLKVAPARFIVHDIKPGNSYDLYQETGLRLAIYNDDDTTRTWTLSTHRPSERGRWETGYAEIPDPRWCWFEKDDITVGPRDRAYAQVYLRVPDEEKYLNQHWVVTFGIAGESGQGGIALAVDVRAQIETQAKSALNVKPDGVLGLEPGTIRFEDVVPGTTRSASVLLHNNDGTTHTYAIVSLFSTARGEPKTYLTQSYEQIPDARWIESARDIRIRPGGSGELPVRLKIPADVRARGARWEELLLIQPDNGQAGFVRVQAAIENRAKVEQASSRE